MATPPQGDLLGLNLACLAPRERRALRKLAPLPGGQPWPPTASSLLAVDPEALVTFKGIANVTRTLIVGIQNRIRREMEAPDRKEGGLLVPLGVEPPTWAKLDRHLTGDLQRWLAGLKPPMRETIQHSLGIGVPRVGPGDLARQGGRTRQAVHLQQTEALNLLPLCLSIDPDAVRVRLDTAPPERLPAWLPKLRRCFSDDPGFQLALAWLRRPASARGLGRPAGVVHRRTPLPRPGTDEGTRRREGRSAARPPAGSGPGTRPKSGSRFVIAAQEFWATRAAPQPLEALVECVGGQVDLPTSGGARAVKKYAIGQRWLGDDQLLRPRNLWRQVAIAHVLLDAPEGLTIREIAQAVRQAGLFGQPLRWKAGGRIAVCRWAEASGRGRMRHRRFGASEADEGLVARLRPLLPRGGNPVPLKDVWRASFAGVDYWDLRRAVMERGSRCGIHFNGRSGWDRVWLATPDDETADLRILRALREAGRPCTRSELRALVPEIGADYLRTAIRDLLAAGSIRQNDARGLALV